MKKTAFFLIIAFSALASGFAQNEMVFQPTHIIGKRIGPDGVVTKEMVSDFSYDNDGKLTQFDFPEYAVSANYHYTEDFLSQEWIAHQGGHPTFYENNLFTYEDGRLMTKTHLMDQMGISQYWVYSYFDDGRLERIDYRTEDFEYYPIYWLYEYEDDSKTVIESYYTSWATQGTVLRERTTSHYDDDYILSDQLVQKYDATGEPTSTENRSYSYTPAGLLEMCVTQVLTDEQWENSTITQYSYNDEGNPTERIDGSWNLDDEAWRFSKKITFETSEDGQTYTVSFYQRNNDTWVWDTFDHQSLFFSSYLKAQQRAMDYYVYEDMNGEGNINQFEITLELIKKPTYLSVDEKEDVACAVFPNPGKDCITVKTMAEKSVVRFYDLEGRLILAKLFDFQANVSTSNWAKGIYLWEVWNGTQKEASGKWIKE